MRTLEQKKTGTQEHQHWNIRHQVHARLWIVTYHRLIGADWGSRSRVCVRSTLHSAPHQQQRMQAPLTNSSQLTAGKILLEGGKFTLAVRGLQNYATH